MYFSCISEKITWISNEFVQALKKINPTILHTLENLLERPTLAHMWGHAMWGPPLALQVNAGV